MRIHNVFHVALLEPYRGDPNNSAINRPGPVVVEGEDEWEVEKVLDERTKGRAKRKQYLVKWVGWPDSHNTWEDEENLRNAPDLVAQYENEKKQRVAAAEKGREKRPRRLRTKRKDLWSRGRNEFH